MNSELKNKLKDFFEKNPSAKFCMFEKCFNVLGYADRELNNVVFLSDQKISDVKILELNNNGHVIIKGEPEKHVADFISTSIVFGHHSMNGNLYKLMDSGKFTTSDFMEEMKNYDKIGVRDFKRRKNRDTNQQIIMGEDVFVKQYKLSDDKFELEEVKVASKGDVVPLYNGYYNIPLNNGYTRSIRMLNYKHEEDPSFVPPPKEGFFSKIKKSFK